jgi:pimeloyl-ACP methyl ester carboxylesterase
MNRKSIAILAPAALIAARILCASATAAQTPPAQSLIEAPGPQGPLKGTMLVPAPGVAPMMLIIPGSGPTDRDGNSAYGLKASTYKLLAEGLAERGIGTVRIDKRGMFASSAAVADANAVTIDDYVADVGAWIGVIRKETGVSCVWLLGHSEGGLVVLAAAQKLPDICGLVLVSTAGRPLGEVLRTQLRANPANAPILAQAMAAIGSLEAGKRVDVAGMHPALMPLFAPQVQGFLINALSYDPAKPIAAVAKPVLIVQGRRDMQVGIADAERLKEAAPKAELALLPDVNHVLKTVASDDPRANAATYADPSLPLAPGVAEAIATFVAAAPPAR